MSILAACGVYAVLLLIIFFSYLARHNTVCCVYGTVCACCLEFLYVTYNEEYTIRGAVNISFSMVMACIIFITCLLLFIISIVVDT